MQAHDYHIILSKYNKENRYMTPLLSCGNRQNGSEIM